MTAASDAKNEIFLDTLAQTGNVSEASRACGQDKRYLYRKRAEDQVFAQRWEEALTECVDRIEREAFRRAVEGVDEPVIHQGRLSYEYVMNPDGTVRKDADGLPIVAMDSNGLPKHLSVRKYSDSLLQTLLKGNLPSKYRENSTIKIGNDGEPFKVEESPTAVARKIAFALALGLRASQANENAASVDSAPATGQDDGADLV